MGDCPGWEPSGLPQMRGQGVYPPWRGVIHPHLALYLDYGCTALVSGTPQGNRDGEQETSGAGWYSRERRHYQKQGV